MRQVLLRCPPLAASAPDALAEVLRRAAIVQCARRVPLYAQGRPAQFVFVVATGRLRLLREGGNGRAVTLGYAIPGDLVGESALGSPAIHHESAIASDALEAVRIPLRVASRLVESSTAFAASLLMLVLSRRLAAESRLTAMVSRSVESRLAEFLLDALERHGIPESRGQLIGVKFTHQEIATVVGATRETVTLALGELRRRGQLLFDHRRIVVRDAAALGKLL